MVRVVAHRVAFSMCTYFLVLSSIFLAPHRISMARDCVSAEQAHTTHGNPYAHATATQKKNTHTQAPVERHVHPNDTPPNTMQTKQRGGGETQVVYLVVGAVGAGHQLTVHTQRGEPRLQVVLLGGGIVQLTGHDVHHVEGEVQALRVESATEQATEGKSSPHMHTRRAGKQSQPHGAA
jgi:hypothetical protein